MIFAACPVGLNVYVFAQHYEVAIETASSAILISTALAMVDDHRAPPAPAAGLVTAEALVGRRQSSYPCRREAAMAEFYLAVGDQVRFAKTVSESDVYLFAGDHRRLRAQLTSTSEYMRCTRYGRRHRPWRAAWSASCRPRRRMMVERHGGLAQDETPVSLGYDRIRSSRRCSSATPSP